MKGYLELAAALAGLSMLPRMMVPLDFRVEVAGMVPFPPGTPPAPPTGTRSSSRDSHTYVYK